MAPFRSSLMLIGLKLVIRAEVDVEERLGGEVDSSPAKVEGTGCTLGRKMIERLVPSPRSQAIHLLLDTRSTSQARELGRQVVQLVVRDATGQEADEHPLLFFREPRVALSHTARRARLGHDQGKAAHGRKGR